MRIETGTFHGGLGFGKTMEQKSKMNKLFSILILFISFNLFAEDTKRLNDPQYLKLYLPLSKDSKDYSGNNNHGTWTTEAYQNGPVGKDVGYFNGSTALINIGNVLNPLTNSFSICGFINCRSSSISIVSIISKKQTLATIGDSGWNIYTTAIPTSYGPTFLLSDDVNRYFIQCGTPLVANRTYYICAVLNKSIPAAYIYIDGKLANFSSSGTLSSLGSISNSVNMLIGNQGNGSNPLLGNESSIRYYNTALSPSEVSALYKMESFIPKLTMQEQPFDILPDPTDPTLIYAGLNAATVNSARDYSSYARHGTATSVNWAKVGGKFNGATSLFNTGTNFISTNEMTFCAWIYPVGYGEGSLGNIFNNGKALLYTQSSGAGSFGFRSDASTTALSANGALLLNKWSLILVTRTLSGTANVYVNGVLSGTADQNSGTPLNAATTSVFIGGRSSGDFTFNGIIKNAIFYNRILTQSEITSLYRASVPDSSLQLALWNGKDYSRHARQIANYKVSTGNGPMRFNGADSYLSTPDFIGTNDFTAVVWFRANGYGELYGGFYYGSFFNNGRTSSALRSPISGIGSTSGADTLIQISNIGLIFPQWNCVTIVRSGTNITHYINGLQRGTTQYGGVLTAATTALFIGNSSTGAYSFDGLIGPLLIYDRVLTADEIKAKYDETKLFF